LNVFSFADDLALIADSKKTIRKYLQILERWCNKNFFQLNNDKSGILKIGEVELVSENELRINGKPMQTLDNIKYLGFKIPKSGSWDMDFDSKIQKARGALARNRTFLSRYDIPFLLRLQVGRSLILSILTHAKTL